MSATTNSLTSALRGILTSAEDGEREAEGLSAWVHSIAAGAPDEVVKAFIGQVSAIRQHKQNVRAQSKQLEVLLQCAEPHIRDLEYLLDQSALPLSAENRKTATSVDSLLKIFAQTYFELAETLGSKWFRVLYARYQPQAALRAAQLIHRRAQIAHRVYSNGSPQRWRQYLALLTMTQEANTAAPSMEQAALSDAEALVRVVIQSALATLSDPSSLNEHDITCVRLYIERYAHLAVLRSTPPEAEVLQGSGIFILTARGPRRPTNDLLGEPGVFYLDTRPLLSRLDQQINGLQQGKRPAQLGLPATTRESAYLALLSACRLHWSEPRKRRHARNGVQPRVDLVAGFEAVYEFVAQNGLKRRRSDTGPLEPAQASSEWAIIDQSEGGFGLRFIGGHTGSIAVGEVIALRFKDRASIAICVSRRARSVSSSEFELGVEILSERALVAALPDKQAADPGARMPVLLLPKLAGGNGAPALIVGADKPTSALSLTVRNNGAPVRLSCTALLDSLASCNLLEMKVQPA